jgi:hypothetical protein
MGLTETLLSAVEVAKGLAGKKPNLPLSLPGAYEGPDDTWPDEEVNELEMVSPTPEIEITTEWGLVLPGGHIAWNHFQGVYFDNPMDRIHMIARLQQTAQDVGFEMEEFLGRYGWATRSKIAAVVYEGTGAYGLADQQVIESGNPEGES